jgi:hypothetical protein
MMVELGDIGCGVGREGEVVTTTTTAESLCGLPGRGPPRNLGPEQPKLFLSFSREQRATNKSGPVLRLCSCSCSCSCSTLPLGLRALHCTALQCNASASLQLCLCTSEIQSIMQQI